MGSKAIHKLGYSRHVGGLVGWLVVGYNALRLYTDGFFENNRRGVESELFTRSLSVKTVFIFLEDSGRH